MTRIKGINVKKSLKIKKSSINLVLLIILIIIILVLIFVSIILPKMIDDEIIAYTEHETSMIVGDYVGFNLEPQKIYFGTVLKGGYGERFIAVNSTVKGEVYITASGEFADEIYIGKDVSTLDPTLGTMIPIYAIPKKDTKYGTYDSTIHVYILKDKDPFILNFLKGSELKYVNPSEFINRQNPNILINITNSSDN